MQKNGSAETYNAGLNVIEKQQNTLSFSHVSFNFLDNKELVPWVVCQLSKVPLKLQPQNDKPLLAFFKMCEYTDTTTKFSNCKEREVKHQVEVRFCYLCEENAQIEQKHYDDSTASTSVLFRSPRAAGDGPTCASMALWV